MPHIHHVELWRIRTALVLGEPHPGLRHEVRIHERKAWSNGYTSQLPYG